MEIGSLLILPIQEGLMTNLVEYKLQKKLSRNTYTDIYHGTHLHDKSRVTLKLPHDGVPVSQQFAILQHEYHLLKQLCLPGIIQVHNFIQTKNTPALVLEELIGISLQEYLNKQPLDLNRFFNLAMQLLDIIGELHQRHIIHKDICPVNIFIDPDTLTLKLVDMSIATQLSEEIQDYINLKQLEGTLAYISPEQTGRMNRPIDYRTDFYSLGVTFFEMLTGRLPFQTDDTLELVHCHLAKPAPLVTAYTPAIPTMLATIIAKLLAKIPEERYASIAGLKADIQRCASQWQQHAAIDDFALGQQDVHDHLHISHQLYGRELQVEELLKAFERISQGSKGLVLIAGYSGIGKTSLVKEVHKPIVRRRGYFIQGKFDQLQRSMPYSAIVTAFQGLVKQLLAEDENILAQYKQALLNTLGDAGQIIIDILPEIELIIGHQTAAPLLNPTEAAHRFHLVLQKFIRIFASSDHPLVIFLDDLQWADNASLKLIEHLLQDTETNHLLLLGAYRDNEVDNSHSLLISVQQLHKVGIPLQTLTLKPLQLSNIEQLLADTLSCSVAKVTPLATCLLEKTQGNPFFINEFLKIIYQKHLLTFSYEQGHWEWDLAQINWQGMMDNVIDLLTLKIHQLSLPAQEILKLAACIGHQFNLQTLVIISEQFLLKTAQQLWEAIENHLILPLEEANKTIALIEANEAIFSLNPAKLNYRFAHDRIQQAAYQLIPSNVTQPIHLKIGRLLLKEQPLQEQDERLFDILDHFNQSLSLITTAQEKHQLARLNLQAGIKAKTSTAYHAAKNYLQAGITLLEPINWQEDYGLVFALYRELATCKYLTAEYTEAQADFTKLLQVANNTLDKIDIYQLNIQMLSTLNKHPEAITLGLSALRLLKIHLPKKANTLHILRAVLKIKMQTHWRNVNELPTLPLMQSPEHRAAADLLSQLLNNAFISDQRLFVLLACTDVSFSLQHGYTESTSMASLVYAFTLMHALNWFSEGLTFVELYSRLKDKYGEAQFAGKNHLVLGTFIDPWRYPIKDCFDTLIKGQQIAYEVGDIVYSNYCNIVGVITASLVGMPLLEQKKHINNTITFINKAKINDFQNVAYFCDYKTKALTNEITFDLAELKVHEQKVLTGENNTDINLFYSNCTELCYLLGNFNEAQQFARKHANFSEFALGILSNFTNLFYHALALTANYNNAIPSQRRTHLKTLRKIHRYVKQCMLRNPANFKPYFILLDAELNRLQQKTAKALELYEQAIKTAQEHDALQLIAIANECTGRFYLHELKSSSIARYYFINAYAAYKLWGSLAKCQQLAQQYPEWLASHISDMTIPSAITSNSTGTNMQSLDMLAILKSTQAISGEIQLDKLLQKLLRIVLEDAGAQRGAILIKSDNSWLAEIEGDLTQQHINLLQTDSAETHQALPLSLLNYVQRTQEPLILDEAIHSELAMHDPYIQQARPQSLLIMPLLWQGQLRRILYLENTDNRHAFTQQHLQSLQLLTSQAVISLENAYLYYQATHDPLTGLANRSLLHQMFEYYASYMLREHKKIAILFLDLDNFKAINDMFGHEIGDKVLIYLAEQLKQCLRDSDMATRLGGDEFIILLSGITDTKEVMRVAERIYQKIAGAITVADHEMTVSCSMGISLFPIDGLDIQTLLKHADTALYRAKETGKNQYQFYSTILETEHRQAHMVAIELQHALEQQEFCLHYQPIFDMQTGKLCGLEALLRWQHPEKGILPASAFIENAEKNLLMEPIGKWVLQHAFMQAKLWQQQGILTVPIAINISAVQFKRHPLSQLIKQILQETQLDPRYIELELTETSLIENTEKVLIDSKNLQELGIHLVLDDFGMGYSNLAYLTHLPISKLKIDRLFIQTCCEPNNTQSKTIIEAIIAMAHRLGLQVIAEGVENSSQLKFLRSQQVDAVQGYYLSYPLDPTQCEHLLARLAFNKQID